MNLDCQCCRVLLLLSQTEVTERTMMESALMKMTEAQIDMLSQVRWGLGVADDG